MNRTASPACTNLKHQRWCSKRPKARYAAWGTPSWQPTGAPNEQQTLTRQNRQTSTSRANANRNLSPHSLSSLLRRSADGLIQYLSQAYDQSRVRLNNQGPRVTREESAFLSAFHTMIRGDGDERRAGALKRPCLRRFSWSAPMPGANQRTNHQWTELDGLQHFHDRFGRTDFKCPALFCVQLSNHAIFCDQCIA